MKSRVLYMVFYFLPFWSVAQNCGENLVLNSSFEYYIEQPTEISQWYMAENWGNANSPDGTPDFFINPSASAFNLIGRTQNPKSGDAMMGFVAYTSIATNTREYISSELKEPMNIGETYQICLSFSNGTDKTDNPKMLLGYGVNGIGALFSENPIVQNDFSTINQTPNIEIYDIVYSTDWVTYTFDFIADKNYKYITIGNFLCDNELSIQSYESYVPQFAYYFVDDIMVRNYEQMDVINWQDEISICEGEIIELNAQIEGALGYNWSGANTNAYVAAVYETGIYSVEVETECGIITAQTQVNVITPPQSPLNNYYFFCEGESVVLDVWSENINSYYWEEIGGTSPKVEIREEGVYHLTIENDCGSLTVEIEVEMIPNEPINYTSYIELSENQVLDWDLVIPNIEELVIPVNLSPSDISFASKEGIYNFDLITDCGVQEMMIEVVTPWKSDNENCEIVIPSTISPNNDGNNDFLQIMYSNCTFLNYELLIFDRWGQVIFHTTSPNDFWKPTQTSVSGAYMYYLNYAFENNATSSSSHIKKGTILLIK